MRETSFKIVAWVRNNLVRTHLSKIKTELSYVWKLTVTLSGKTALSYKSGSEISFRKVFPVNFT